MTYFLHTSLVGYSSYFTKSKQFKEGGGDNQNLLQTSINESLNDIEELSNTNECYRQKCREVRNKNTKSPSVSHRSTSAKKKPRSNGLQTRKTLV
jgi:hypothetical protein